MEQIKLYTVRGFNFDNEKEQVRNFGSFYSKNDAYDLIADIYDDFDAVEVVEEFEVLNLILEEE